MTTRRRRRPTPPWRGRTGRFGLFGPEFAISVSLSVKPRQRGLYPHGLTQRSVEGAPRGRALEAGKPPAGVDAATRAAFGLRQLAGARHEPHEVALRRLAPASGARPDRIMKRLRQRSLRLPPPRPPRRRRRARAPELPPCSPPPREAPRRPAAPALRGPGAPGRRSTWRQAARRSGSACRSTERRSNDR